MVMQDLLGHIVLPPPTRKGVGRRGSDARARGSQQFARWTEILKPPWLRVPAVFSAEGSRSPRMSDLPRTVSQVNYNTEEKFRAVSWKRSTPTLPASARVPAPYVGKDGKPGHKAYDFCVPSQHAALSLLPEVRQGALDLFADLQIPWHAGINGGPSNHLLSSQVQCVNALGQMVSDPSRIVGAFGDLLGIGEVLQIEPGRYLTFEYIGPTDFFGEVPGGQRIRGAHCTSVDAAFVHRGLDDVVELVLVEWKYTESYPARRPDLAKDAVRRRRYGAAFADPQGPVRADVLAFEFVLDEPFYQLVRQQLLAHALEQSGAEGAARVRVVHVLSPDNAAYQESMWRPEHRALGDTVSQAWQQLLRRRDRFVSMDSALFLDPTITSWEYCNRYGAPLIHDLPELLNAYELDDADGLPDSVDFEGELIVEEEGLELQLGRFGTLLAYPFTIAELNELVAELEAEVG